jgi:hypothetical protein
MYNGVHFSKEEEMELKECLLNFVRQGLKTPGNVSPEELRILPEMTQLLVDTFAYGL